MIKKQQSNKPKKMEDYFPIFASAIADLVGHPLTFIVMLLLTLVWFVSGPFFGFSDTWQLIINTVTTVLTFLMVFIIQNTQNRDTKAIQLKLDELVRSHSLAHNSIIDVNKLNDKQMKELEKHYSKISKTKSDDSEED